MANIHIASKGGNEVDIAQVAQLATTSKTECIQKITNELVSSIKEHVTSGSDLHSTHNADKDGGPSRPRRHGLELVRQSETWMSEWTPEQMSDRSWMARVQIVTWTRMEV
jgi:hypothetical protein